MFTIKTKEIGELVLEYFPLDNSGNVYRHTPPDTPLVKVTTERLVLEPRSALETYGIPVATAIVGGLIVYESMKNNH